MAQTDPSDVLLISQCLIVLELCDFGDSMFAPSDFFKVRADMNIAVPKPGTYAQDLQFKWLREYDHLKIKLPSD